MHRHAFCGRALARVAPLLIAVFAGACQNTSTDTSLSNYDTLVITAVDENIEAVVGQPTPIRIRVSDETGRTVPNAPVSLAVLSATGFVSPTIARTNDLGVAEAIWVLGANAGSQELEITGNDARLYRSFRRLVLKADAQPAEPYSVEIVPSGATLAIGESRAFEARVKDRYGNTLTGREITWSVSNTGVARVDSRGVATGVAAGTTPLTAYTRTSTGSRVEGYGWIAVQAATLAPDSTTVPDTTAAPGTTGAGEGEPAPTGTPGQVGDLSVVSFDASSVVISFTQVSDGDGGPAQYAVRRGSPSVDWWYAASTERLIEGTQVGETIEYRYTGLNAGTDYEFQVVAYRGVLSLTALFGELSNKVSVRTASAPTSGPVGVVSVTASAQSHQFAALEESRTFTATARDGGGTSLPGTTFNWSSLNPSIASVSGSGTVTARSNGSTAILVAATCCALAVDTIGVTVAQVPVRIGVTPASFTLGVGQTRQLSATVSDANDNVVPSVTPQWSSSRTGVATVTSAGVAAGVTSGTAALQARYSTLSSTSDVQVTSTVTGPPAMPSSITTSPVTGGVSASWTSVTGATSYFLAWGPHDGSSGQTKSVTSSPTTLSASGDGYVCVRAVAGGLQSEPRCTSYSAGTTSASGSTGTGSDSTGGTTGGTTLPPPPPPSGVWYEKAWPATLGVGGDVVGFSGTTHSIQTGTLIDGSTGRFLRSASNGVHEYSHGVDLVMPNADSVRPREIWVDTSMRFTGTGWATSVDDKTFFVMLNTEAYEWRTFLRGSGNGSMYGGPYPRPNGPQNGDWQAFDSSPLTLFNGQWHSVRYHLKMGTTETATDGAYEVWIDGTRVISRTLRTGNPTSEYFKYLVLGRNSYVSNGAAREWGSVRVYTANPGW